MEVMSKLGSRLKGRIIWRTGHLLIAVKRFINLDSQADSADHPEAVEMKRAL